jgi:hypothetical protein
MSVSAHSASLATASAGAGLSRVDPPASRARANAAMADSSGVSSWVSATWAASRAAACSPTNAGDSSALAPGPITMVLRPSAST